MLQQILLGGLVSFINFGIHAVMTGLIVVATHHTKVATDDFHVFFKVAAMMLVTTVVLTLAHVIEIGVWAGVLSSLGIAIANAGVFEFAFENYVALGYGDVVAGGGWRLVGPIMALNGLLLIGWSVAIIFEVIRLADIYVDTGRKRSR